MRTARESKQLDKAWSSSLLARSREANELKARDAKERMEAALSGKLNYDDLTKYHAKGLLGTTILEEDDSED